MREELLLKRPKKRFRKRTYKEQDLASKNFFEKASAYYYAHEYQKAIVELNESMEKDFRGESAPKCYFSLGQAYYFLGDDEQAISNFKIAKNCAVDDNEKAEYIFWLGKALYSEEKYDEALVFFKDSILKREKLDFQFWECLTLYTKKSYSEAIDKFNKLVESKINRGEIFFWNAMAYYAHWKETGGKITDESFKRAKELFDKACDKESSLDFSYWRLRLFLDETEKDIGISYNYIYKEAKSLPYIKQCISIFEDCINDSLEVDIILNLLGLCYWVRKFMEGLRYTGDSVYHYTSNISIPAIFNTDKPIIDGFQFRMSNAVHTNDPSEGLFFLSKLTEELESSRALSERKDLRSLKDFLETVYQNSVIHENSNTYLLSFTKRESSDFLPLWGMYGADGKGICIEIPRECITKNSENTYENSSVVHNDNLKIKYLDSDLNELYNEEIEVFSVTYLDSIVEDQLIKKFSSEIATTVNKINDNIKNCKSITDRGMLKRIIRDIFDSLRFLYKSSSYNHENEVRVIGYEFDKNNINLIKPAEGKVPRLYIKLDSKIDYKKISVILGPKLEKPLDVSTYLNYVGVKEVTRSKIKYQ